MSKNPEHLYIVRMVHTVCPGSSDPFCNVTYYMKWVTTSWTYSTKDGSSVHGAHKWRVFDLLKAMVTSQESSNSIFV